MSLIFIGISLVHFATGIVCMRDMFRSGAAEKYILADFCKSQMVKFLLYGALLSLVGIGVRSLDSTYNPYILFCAASVCLGTAALITSYARGYKKRVE